MFSGDVTANLTAIRESDLVYLLGISIAVLSQSARDVLWQALPQAHSTGALVAFDSNYRPKLWDTFDIARQGISRFLQITNIALPSPVNENVLFNDPNPRAIAKRLKDSGAKFGTVKCGHNGPLPLNDVKQSSTYHAAENVVDTTGAGDRFNGAYLAAITRKDPQISALEKAHDLAIRVVSYQGAIIPAATS